MKVAIHHRKRSFSDRWIEYCQENKIDFILVDIFENDALDKIKECNIFLWHPSHGEISDKIAAKSILFSIEKAGKLVFPNFDTLWHFDDKISQKYLMEAIEAPAIKTYIFFNKKEAIDWVNKTTFPKVFKLSGGAGASNVKLIQNKGIAITKVNKAFGKGFAQFNKIDYLRNQYKKGLSQGNFIKEFSKGIIKSLISTKFSRNFQRERNYIYFQDFISNNNFDTRVIIIGERAFAIKRINRKNDFRASGSGNIIYDHKEININCIKTAFEVNKKLKSQCIAYDFVIDENGRPLIIEVSFGFSVKPYDKCPGYWSKDLVWNEGNFNPQYWMIENLINSIDKK